MPQDYKRAENCQLQEFNILISDVTNSTPTVPITSLTVVKKENVKKRKEEKIGKPCMAQLVYYKQLFYFRHSLWPSTSHIHRGFSSATFNDRFVATQGLVTQGSLRVTALKFPLSV